MGKGDSPLRSEEMTMNNASDTQRQTDDTRLRAIRFFSDICSGKAPADGKRELVEKVRYLEAMSDEELSDLGLLREDILEHVFQDARFI